jgi:acyl-[acyl-carrier-protein]-phospholipid O-acyltransferase / long-chain-fatty-acid--[acyl-carrier-protein] ligase
MYDEQTRQRIRQARGKFAAMAATYALGVFNDNFFKQAAVFLAIPAGLANLQGWATVLFALPFIVLAAPAGWLADRFPKRRIVIASKALELVAVLCGAAGICAGNWGLILVMIFIMGVQATIFSPSLNGSIPELYPAQYVTTANGVVKGCTTAAILLGIATAGLAGNFGKTALATRLGLGQSVLGIPIGQATVACVVVVVAVLGLAGSLGVPGRPAAAPTARFPWAGLVDTGRTILSMRADRLLAVVVAADVFIWFAGTLQVQVINLLGLSELKYSQVTTSLMVGAELVGLAFGGLLSGRLARGPRWHRVLAPSAGAMAIVMALIPLAVRLADEPPFVCILGLPIGPRLACLLGLLGAGGLFGGLFMIPCESFIQVRPPADRKGAIIAAANAAAFVGIMLAGPACNGINAIVHPSTGFAMIAGLSLAAAGVLPRMLRGAEEDTEA